MPKKAAKKASKKAMRLNDVQVCALAREFEEHRAAEGREKKAKEDAQSAVVQELWINRKKTKSISRTFDDEVMHVTVVAATRMIYDPEGIYSVLSPKERRLCFERNIDLNALSDSARKAILDSLPKSELERVTTWVLDEDALSEAVQSDKIPAKKIAPFAEERENKPYISVTHEARR